MVILKHALDKAHSTKDMCRLSIAHLSISKIGTLRKTVKEKSSGIRYMS